MKYEEIKTGDILFSDNTSGKYYIVITKINQNTVNFIHYFIRKKDAISYYEYNNTEKIFWNDEDFIFLQYKKLKSSDKKLIDCVFTAEYKEGF